MGPYTRDSTQGPAQWRKIKSKLLPHPNYNEGTHAYDFLMFKIESVTKKNLKTIKLNKSNSNPSKDEKVRVIGMGLNDDGEISNVLEKVTLTAISHADCKAAWESSGVVIDETVMVCASTTGGKDVCGGASQRVGMWDYGDCGFFARKRSHEPHFSVCTLQAIRAGHCLTRTTFKLAW